jgi:hypothetical protein
MRRSFLAALALALSLPVAAVAQEAPGEPPPAAADPGAVPDAVYRAVKDRIVAIRTRAGIEVVGRLLAEEAQTVTLAAVPTGEVVVLAKVDVAGVRLVEPVAPPPAPAAVAAAPAPEPPLNRHFGLLLGLAPALNIDLDYGLFYGFANASLVLPIASGGDLAGFSVGVGTNFNVSAHHPGLKLEVFAYTSPARLGSDEWVYGFGVGIGLHYTFRSGFSIGFKAPILGYSVNSRRSSYSSSSSSGEAVAEFYLSSAMGLPIFSLGYRF